MAVMETISTRHFAPSDFAPPSRFPAKAAAPMRFRGDGFVPPCRKQGRGPKRQLNKDSADSTAGLLCCCCCRRIHRHSTQRAWKLRIQHQRYRRFVSLVAVHLGLPAQHRLTFSLPTRFCDVCETLRASSTAILLCFVRKNT